MPPFEHQNLLTLTFVQEYILPFLHLIELPYLQEYLDKHQHHSLLHHCQSPTGYLHNPLVDHPLH